MGEGEKRERGWGREIEGEKQDDREMKKEKKAQKWCRESSLVTSDEC